MHEVPFNITDNYTNNVNVAFARKGSFGGATSSGVGRRFSKNEAPKLSEVIVLTQTQTFSTID